MADPYRSGYYQPPTHQSYQPSSYAPPAPDQYASGALTTRHHSRDDTYYPSQSNMQLSQSSYRPSSSDSRYLDPSDTHRSDRSHHHKSRSHSRHDSKHRDHDHDRHDRSKSRTKEWGSTAVGAAAGGLLGNELGHGPLATIGGLVAGAYGAHELEKRHERHKEKKRGGAGERGDDGGERYHHRRRSSGGLLGGLKSKVEGFLDNPDRDDRRERRSKSHVSSSRRDYEYEDEGYDDRRRGGRRGRDDGY